MATGHQKLFANCNENICASLCQSKTSKTIRLFIRKLSISLISNENKYIHPLVGWRSRFEAITWQPLQDQELAPTMRHLLPGKPLHKLLQRQYRGWVQQPAKRAVIDIKKINWGRFSNCNTLPTVCVRRHPSSCSSGTIHFLLGEAFHGRWLRSTT